MTEQVEILFIGALVHEDALPTEIQLFKPGLNATQKGDFLLDEEAAAAVMARFLDEGQDQLPFDVGHGMIQPTTPDSHRAMGWFTPEVREVVAGEGPSLFATNIEWTETAIEALRKREFRFFSPAVSFDRETRRITKLWNVALTNLPATKGQTPLVLDASGAEQETQEKPKMEVLLSALDASDEASAVSAVKGMQDDFVALLGAVGAESRSDAVAKIESLVKGAEEARAELSALKDEVAAEKRSIAIDQLIDAKKLLPAQREFAASLSAEQFEMLSATAQPIPALTQTIVEPEKGEAKGKTEGADFNVDEFEV